VIVVFTIIEGKVKIQYLWAIVTTIWLEIWMGGEHFWFDFLPWEQSNQLAIGKAKDSGTVELQSRICSSYYCKLSSGMACEVDV
jgi:hypothetical protein